MADRSDAPFASLPQVPLTAPVIFLDAVTAFSLRDGVAELILEVLVNSQDTRGQAVPGRAVSAYLRMSLRGAASLQHALEKIALAAAPTPDKPS